VQLYTKQIVVLPLEAEETSKSFHQNPRNLLLSVQHDILAIS